MAAKPSKRTGRLWPVHLVLAIGAVVMISPYAFQLVTSFKTYADSISVPLRFLPHAWVISNYTHVFAAVPFASMFKVSVLVTILETLGSVVFGTTAAYAFARLRFPGRNVLFVLCLAALMIPRETLLLPNFEVISRLHLVNTTLGIVLPHLFAVFSMFLLRQFFASIPVEIEEAARLDGAGTVRTFLWVVLPLSRSGLIAVAIFAVLASWNGLLWPLIVINDVSHMPLTAGLATLQNDDFANIPLLMAGSVLATLPLIVMFIVMQRQFIQGISLSASKG